MQFKANDGSSHPSQMKAYEASQKPAAAPEATDQPKSIQDDPQAMQLVDQLKQMGYTADDVEQAMGGGDDTGAGALQSGQEATQAAPLNIPGM
jgi:hypothetical protein